MLQFTPPGSGCSVIFGKNVTAAAPGSAQGLYLIVSDVDAARRELLDRGVEVSGVFHNAGVYTGKDEPYRSGEYGSAALIRSMAAIARSRRFAIQTATGGSFQELTTRLPGRIDSSATYVTPPQMIWRMRCDARNALTASTKSVPAKRDETGRHWYAEYMVSEQTGDKPPE